MRGMRALWLVLAVVTAVLVLRAVPAYSSHGGVMVTALAIDPLTPTTLYAGTAGGVFKSMDGGASWSAIGLINVSALAIDPLTPTTVYAGIGTFDMGALGGVFKSTDGGVSWNATGSLTGIVWSLAIDPLTPTTVYAGTLGYDSFDTEPGSLGGVYKSTDGGASWSRGLSNVSALAIDPLTPNTLYAGVYDEAANDSAVYKSTDGGASWNAIGLTGVGGVLVLAIDPTSTNLYAGTGTSGVYKSTNSGVDWRPTGQITWSHVSSVSVNPTSVVGGSPSNGMVTLSAAAPAGGAMVHLATGDSNIATVPASVTVQAGATSAAFTVSHEPGDCLRHC